VVYGKDGKRHGTIAKRCAVCKQVFWPAQGHGVTCSEGCKKARQRDMSRIQQGSVSRIQAPNRDITEGRIRDIAARLDDAARADLTGFLTGSGPRRDRDRWTARAWQNRLSVDGAGLATAERRGVFLTACVRPAAPQERHEHE
jgi:hypothetical protein